MKQQTAVEWLYNQLDGFSDEEWGKIDNLFEQAKQMEKEQIVDAHMYSSGNSSIVEAEYIAEQYYNETYGGQGSPDTTTSPNTQNK